jgi:hypothetical protein
MPKPTYRICKTCHRSTADVGPLSHTRQCVECGHLKLEQNALGMHIKSGEAWTRWRRSMAASVGGVLLDEVPRQS